jgi:hypothetical protein
VNSSRVVSRSSPRSWILSPWISSGPLSRYVPGGNSTVTPLGCTPVIVTASAIAARTAAVSSVTPSPVAP